MSRLLYNIHGREFHVSPRFRPIAPIGTGAYGQVCAFTNTDTDERVAIKKIPNAFQSSLAASRTLREIVLLRHTDHENIISMKDVIVPDAQEEFQDVYIVYELMDTDLHRIVQESKLDNIYCQFFIYQLLRGLKYLHSGNILHRDLKPSNILVNCNDCLLKICDFGLARTSSEDEFLTEYVVTRPYRAPELLLGSRMYTTAVDMWSTGCIFIEMLTGQPLFPARSRQEHPVHHLKLIAEVLGSPEEAELAFLTNEDARRQIQGFLSGHVRNSLSSKFPNVAPDALDLAERMLRFDPAKRISAVDALDHPYLSNLHDITDEPTCPTFLDTDCDHASLTVEQIKDMIWKEAQSMNSQRLF